MQQLSSDLGSEREWCCWARRYLPGTEIAVLDLKSSPPFCAFPMQKGGQSPTHARRVMFSATLGKSVAIFASCPGNMFSTGALERSLS